MHKLQKNTLHDKIMSINHSRPDAEGNLKIKYIYINVLHIHRPQL